MAVLMGLTGEDGRGAPMSENLSQGEGTGKEHFLSNLQLRCKRPVSHAREAPERVKYNTY